MLHEETVSNRTLELLKLLMQDPVLESFNLVGDTALSLKLGHRISIDLDLFTINDFNQEKLNGHLANAYNFRADFIEKNTLKGNIDGVAVDLISHKYKNVKPHDVYEVIRLTSFDDISAMKLNAIVNNGSRVKDFVDLAFLGEKIPFSKMLKAYELKYNVNPVMVPKAVLYHEDIDHSVEIDLLTMKYDFLSIKDSLERLVSKPNELHIIGHKRG